MYDFSPKAMCDFLHIPLYNFDDFAKKKMMWMKWQLSCWVLNLNGLSQILSRSHMWPWTTRVYTRLLWPTGGQLCITAPSHQILEKLLFWCWNKSQGELRADSFQDCCWPQECEEKKNWRLPFPSLIYGILLSQRELKTTAEYLTKKKPLVSHRLKEDKAKREKIEETVEELAIAISAIVHNLVVASTSGLDPNVLS